MTEKPARPNGELIEFIYLNTKPKNHESWASVLIERGREATKGLPEERRSRILRQLKTVEEAITKGDIGTACVFSMLVGAGLGRKWNPDLRKARELKIEQIDGRRKAVVDLFNELKSDVNRKHVSIYNEISKELNIPTRTVQKYVSEAGLVDKRRRFSKNRAQR